MTTTDPTGPVATRCTADRPVALRVHHVIHTAVDICILAVDGELDMATAPLLDAAVCEQLALVAASTQVILDVGHVRFVSCSGLRWLLGAPDLARLTDRRLHLAGGANRAVARLLHLTGLGEVLPTHIHPTVADALKALGA